MKQKCSVDGCDLEVHAKGFCKPHYKRQWRTGSVESSRPCYHEPIEQKFWHYVKRDEETECWEWLGYKDKDGYGHIGMNATPKKVSIGAHRASWQLHYGEIPSGQMVLHKCNNPSCVNPNHLYLGDHHQNMQDRLNSGHYAKNENHPNAKFSNDVVKQIRESNLTNRELSRQFGISESQVGNIKHGRQRIIDEGSESV